MWTVDGSVMPAFRVAETVASLGLEYKVSLDALSQTNRKERYNSWTSLEWSFQAFSR